MKNKTKADAVNIGSIDNLNQDLTNNKCTTLDDEPQYICSFCLKRVWNDLSVLNGVGACLRCKNLALHFSHYFWEEFKIDDGEDE
jgi:hypothetical protein